MKSGVFCGVVLICDVRQVPLSVVKLCWCVGFHRVTHHPGDLLELRLRVGVAAQVEEIVPVGCCDHACMPGKRLQQTVGVLLVDAELVQSSGVLDSLITCT